MIDVIIIGAGGHAVSVANVVNATSYSLKGFVDRNKAGGTLFGLDIHEDEKAFFDNGTLFCIAIGANTTRERVANRLLSDIGIERFPSVVHPSAEVGLGSKVGFGTVIMPNSTVGPKSTIGNFCILNTNSSIDHDSQMHDFSSLAPGVTTGGNVTIGERSAVSIGATLKHGISIGSDTVVGAASYVNKDIAKNCVAYGTPAKVIRDRASDDTYL